MKKILTLLAFMLLSFTAFSQQDPQFSQFMHNKLFMNPGYAGMKHALCATGIFRNQWNGFAGAPNSGVLSADMWMPRWGGGVGLNVMFDKLGFESNVAVRGCYSFHVNIGEGRLGIGAELGMFSKRIGPTGSDQWIATTNWTNDVTIPPQMKKTVFDMGLGLWYERRNIWFGISSTHLPAQLADNGLSAPTGNPPLAHNRKYQFARHYFITGGINLFEGNTWEIRPSFLVKSDATITSFDLNAIALYDQRFWFGVSYRWQDAVCPMIGFQRVNAQGGGMKMGFAYDYTTSKLNSYSNGTFEIFLNYCIPINIDVKCTRYFDVRLFD
jgi:type IX secretion system PorP/SprF family membrane protein